MVTLRGVTVGALTRAGQEFTCRLQLDNPNDRELDVVGGQVTLDIADFSAGRGRTESRFSIPAHGTAEADIKVTVDLLATASAALRWLLAGNPSLDYTLKGYVDLDLPALGRIPFRSSGKVDAEKLWRQLPGLLRSAAPPAGLSL